MRTDSEQRHELDRKGSDRVEVAVSDHEKGVRSANEKLGEDLARNPDAKEEILAAFDEKIQPTRDAYHDAIRQANDEHRDALKKAGI